MKKKVNSQSEFYKVNYFNFNIYMKPKTTYKQCLGISMIVCQNPLTKKYLVIQETDKTWWLPGGRVDAP